MSTLIRYAGDDIVIDTKKISTSTWADNTNELTTFHTQSTQTDQTDVNSQGNFFFDIYNMETSSISASKEMSIGYGHLKGSGSLDFVYAQGSFGISPTMVNYMQYRQLIYGDENQFFTFDTYTPDDIWIINIERANYKHNLKPGSLNLVLSGSGGTLELTDDFATNSGSATISMLGRQFNIVSGASGVQSGSTLSQTPYGSYGLFYPDAGVIILNPTAVSGGIPVGGGNCSGITPVTGSNNNDNNTQKLLNAIAGGDHSENHSPTNPYNGSFILDSEEKVTSQYYFTRVKNNEFNYTTNPSYIDDTGTLRFSSMTDNPTVYITTVGMYSEGGDLLAVAKLSKPLAKDFTKESLIRVKVDY